MSFRAQQLYNKIVRKVGDEWMTADMKKTLKRSLPNNKSVMGRAERGLFAGRHIQFGNQVSEDGGNKTRRSWKPNVQGKRLFSYIYNQFIRVKVTTHTLRCIDKAGGIDEYLLRTPYHKMDNEMGVLWKAKMQRKYEELEKTERDILSLIETRRKQRQGLVELEGNDGIQTSGVAESSESINKSEVELSGESVEEAKETNSSVS